MQQQELQPTRSVTIEQKENVNNDHAEENQGKTNNNPDGNASDMDSPINFNECSMDSICKNKEVRVRCVRFAFIMILPGLCLLILTFNPETELSFMIGIGLIVMYFIYFGIIGYFFWSGTRKSRYLFRIHTKAEPGD